MPLSTSLRGKEGTILIAIDGQPKDFIFTASDISISERGDLPETAHLGKKTATLDYIHSGWDVNFSTEIENDEIFDLITLLTDNDIHGRAHPEVTLTLLYNVRGSSGAVIKEVYFDGVIRAAERSHGGQDEYITQSFECKFERRKQY